MWQWFIHSISSSFTRNEKTTVRYAFPIVALTALFAGLAAVSTQNGSYISITTSQSNVQADETFTIEVKANAHVPVNAVDIVIDYPEEHIQIEGIDIGTSVITLWTEKPYARNGNVYLRGGVFQKGFLGEHTIARIRAKATATGLAYVNLESASLVAGDGKGTTVQVEKISDTQTRIYVSAADGSLEGTATIDIVTDLDGDGSVSLADISAFMGAWFSKSKTFDFNGDGRMTFKDFSILLADSFFK